MFQPRPCVTASPLSLEEPRPPGSALALSGARRLEGWRCTPIAAAWFGRARCAPHHEAVADSCAVKRPPRGRSGRIVAVVAQPMGHQADPAFDAEFLQDRDHVLMRRARREAERLADLALRQVGEEEAQHRLLARGERRPGRRVRRKLLAVEARAAEQEQMQQVALALRERPLARPAVEPDTEFAAGIDRLAPIRRCSTPIGRIASFTIQERSQVASSTASRRSSTRVVPTLAASASVSGSTTLALKCRRVLATTRSRASSRWRRRKARRRQPHSRSTGSGVGLSRTAPTPNTLPAPMIRASCAKQWVNASSPRAAGSRQAHATGGRSGADRRCGCTCDARRGKSSATPRRHRARD